MKKLNEITTKYGNLIIIILILFIGIRSCNTNTKIEKLTEKIEKIDSVNKKCFTKEQITDMFGNEATKLMNASKQEKVNYNFNIKTEKK